MSVALDGRAGAAIRPAGALVGVGGCVALAVRPALLAAGPSPTLVLVGLFGVLVAIGVGGGAWAPRPRDDAPGRVPAGTVVVVTALGVAAFALGRVAGGGRAPVRVSTATLTLNVLAACAEEAWFRRYWYDLLRPAGTAMAVAGPAVLFALVHVATYGVWVVPLDIAAGLLLGWQRHASGTWLAPALTHAIANVLIVL